MTLSSLSIYQLLKLGLAQALFGQPYTLAFLLSRKPTTALTSRLRVAENT
jgi:hypothetical protein